MSEKITLASYLEGRGKVKSLTRIEAEAFGVPYPLISGWPAKYGSTEITPAMLDDLAVRIRTAKASTASRARCGLDGVAAVGASADLSRCRSVAILSAAGVPVHTLSIDRASALDTLVFMAALANEISLEKMAQREGRTFAHPLGQSIGDQPINSITEHPLGQR